jgi:hypothetical protein
MKSIYDIFTAIANQHLDFRTLLEWGSNILSFHDESVRGVKQALWYPYLADLNDRHYTPDAPHNPAPWDCDGMTQWYATPDETDVIDLIEIRAQVTEASWNTVAFVEATWPGAQANARRIAAAVNACEGISTEAIEAGVLQEMREVLEQCSFEMGYAGWGKPEAICARQETLKKVRTVLASARATGCSSNGFSRRKRRSAAA